MLAEPANEAEGLTRRYGERDAVDRRSPPKPTRIVVPPMLDIAALFGFAALFLDAARFIH
jgi:hypothetical protein